MFKTEPHLHTLEVSNCAHVRAKEFVKKYKEAGYSTIFVTDHFNEIVIGSYGDISWSEKMTLYLAGYYRAKCEGDKIGVNVLMGVEINFAGSHNHYLLYGVTKEFLDSNPELHTYGIEKVSKIAKEHGIFIIQAHPYRDGNCYPTLEYVDAVEFNTNPRHADFTEKTEELVKKHNLLVIGGSDAHRNEDIARGGIETENEIKSAEDLIEAVKSGKLKIIRGDI